MWEGTAGGGGGGVGVLHLLCRADNIDHRYLINIYGTIGGIAGQLKCPLFFLVGIPSKSGFVVCMLLKIHPEYDGSVNVRCFRKCWGI